MTNKADDRIIVSKASHWSTAEAFFMTKKLTPNETQLLSTALIFSEKNHPYYKKEIRNLWYRIFQTKEEYEQKTLEFES